MKLKGLIPCSFRSQKNHIFFHVSSQTVDTIYLVSFWVYGRRNKEFDGLDQKEEKKLIEVKGLVKKYGNHLAVDHLSFTVERGQILGFLGPNGAGKSTTMNMITGYISATEGTVIINGHDIYEEPEEAKKSIGYLPEQPPVYPDMTVREYLYFVAELKKVPKMQRKSMIEEIIGRVRLEEVGHRLIKHLSKGYRQRVGFAQAIIGYPEVIILDEPTVGLDPMQIIEIRDLIRDLAKQHTIILSSHILSEISAVCDTIMIINHGKLVVSDTPEMLAKHQKGTNNLILSIKGDKNTVEEALLALEGIEKIEIKENEETHLIEVSIHQSIDIDVHEDVFYALAKHRCPIFEMHTTSVTLEDIFLELTKSEEKDLGDEIEQKTISQDNQGESVVKETEEEELRDDSNL